MWKSSEEGHPVHEAAALKAADHHAKGTAANGEYTQYFTGAKTHIDTAAAISIEPWSYKVFVKDRRLATVQASNRATVIQEHYDLQVRGERLQQIQFLQ